MRLEGRVSERILERTVELASVFLEQLPERPVMPRVGLEDLRATLDGPLPQTGEDPVAVIEALARNAEPGMVASAGPRYFGFVVGGSLPAALAADWLTSAWDENAGLYALSPAAAMVEEVAEHWLVELFSLPPGTSAGFTTGATMANFTNIAAARHRLLADLGWEVEERGLYGSPEISVVVGAEAHVTIFAALQMLGLGRERVIRIQADGQGRMRPDALRDALNDVHGPTIVCAQAGNVNTGAFDPLTEIAPVVHEHGGWLHVDGAFGLWAAVSPRLRHLVDGLATADSWTTDAHKWLNVPYDSGVALVRDRSAHHGAMRLGAAYYVETAGAERDPYNWVPESSRRARGFPVYAALRVLGQAGLVAMIERGCDLARRMADALGSNPGVAILNDVVLNQVLVRFTPPDGGDADAFTRAVIARVQSDSTCWLGGTTWHGMAAMRVSVSNWSTTEADIDRSAEAILRAARSEVPTAV
jgi:glutamate/tyrosine decarboxylase-like PLP-dependent enzyme